MVQIITNNTDKYEEYPANKYKISTLADFDVFDSFDIVYIDLTDKNIWKNKNYNLKELNCGDDLKSLKEEIISSKRCKIIVNLPLNIDYEYYYSGGTYEYKEKIKDIIPNITSILSQYLISFKNIDIVYGKNTTTINRKEYKSDFNINIPESYEKITTADKNERITTAFVNNVYITTLYVSDTYENFENYINALFSMQEKENTPEWAKEIEILNDKELNEDKTSAEEKIEILKEEIEKISAEQKQNSRIKSILYTTGDELVEEVLKILGEMIDYDFSGFVDIKVEDFLFKKGTTTFIGEIKGISSNIKRDNVSQTDLHVQDYLDRLEQAGQNENVKGILIINHQRNKKLEEREEPHINSVNLAERNNCLIIETTTLLKLFEDFRNGKIKSEEIIEKLEKCNGLFKYNSNKNIN